MIADLLMGASVALLGFSNLVQLNSIRKILDRLDSLERRD